MNWANKELSIEHLNGTKSLGRSDVAGIHFTCTCEAPLDIPRNGPCDYSPGSMMAVTGGFLIECPYCGTTFSWNCNSPTALYEQKRDTA